MKITPLNKIGFSGLALLVSLLTPPAHANITANFTDGGGTASVDQYQGIAGSGWNTAWATNTSGTSSGTTFIGSVLNANPLNGGGNYLSTTLTAGSGISKGVVQRQYTNFSNINTAAAHTVSFDLRLDSNLATFTSDTDYLQAFDRPANSDFGSNGSWLIRATGASVNGIGAQRWMFYNGGKNAGAFNNANFVDSGVSLVSGTVYHFDVSIDPATLSYRVSINGGAFSAAMGFRTNTAAGLGTLNFGGQTSAGSEIMTYSLDSIAVIPEPSTTGVGMVLGALALIALRRRRRCQA